MYGGFIMVRFTLPRDLYHGKGSLEALKTLEGKKAIICVGGGSMKRNGFLQKAEDYLKEAGMEVKLFEGIESAASLSLLFRILLIKLKSRFFDSKPIYSPPVGMY